jgi:hypothetical protein
MPVCDACGKVVKDLRRHKARGRYGKRGRKKSALPPKYRLDSPERRVSMDSGFTSY